MGRFEPVDVTRGSQKWLQLLVNDHSELINQKINELLGTAQLDRISWKSPIGDDNFAEYSDREFLDRLGINLENRSLASFWPSGGPHWDALGRSDTKKIFLVEAKAHIEEIISPGCGASPHSRNLIEQSLHEVKHFLNAGCSDDWSQCLYQYANRLAHLYLIRELNGIPAYLVFVYFTGDMEMDGPITPNEWKSALKLVKGILGLPKKPKLSDYVLDIFVDVDQLR
jgi:hypothetical protein